MSDSASTSDTSDPLQITTSLETAARQILNHSFAIYELTDDEGILARASQEALQFFLPPSGEEQRKKFDFQVIHDGHLLGYNEPPPKTKYLFRVFQTADKQPWPSDSFRQASSSVASLLHDTLLSCWREIHTQIGEFSTIIDEQRAENKGNSAESQRQCHPMQEDAKGKVSVIDEPTHASISKISNTLDTASSTWNIRFDEFQREVLTENCPLDYFYYHCLQTDNPRAVNCSEHTDRGILIAVALTHIPGLEILLFNRKEETNIGSDFLCPEEVHRAFLADENSTTTNKVLLCIMVGDHLRHLYQHQLDVPSCIHRVRNRLEQPRLAVSYELRML